MTFKTNDVKMKSGKGTDTEFGQGETERERQGEKSADEAQSLGVKVHRRLVYAMLGFRLRLQTKCVRCIE